jgi:hypothetical protein
MKQDIALLLAALAVGILIGSGVHAFTHRHYQEVIKTTIGEFMIHDGKIYSVYEMERNVKGDMVAR